MTEYLDAERRVANALMRIGAGLENMRPKTEVFSSSRGGQGELDAAKQEVSKLNEEIEARDGALLQLRSELEAAQEQIAVVEQVQAELQTLTSENAALTAERDHLRNATSGETQDDGQVEALRAEIKTLSRALEGLDATQQQLKAANVALRKNNKDLHAAYKDQIGDPSLLNSSLEESLRSIEAERAAERAELDAFREIVTPMLKDANDA